MDPKIKMILIVAAVVIVAVLVIAAIIARSRRTDSLRRRFGSEYDRTVR